MGATGAAIATVSTQAISVLFSLYFITKRNLPFTFSKNYIRFDPISLQKDPIGLRAYCAPGNAGIVFLSLYSGDRQQHGGIESAAVGVAEKVCVFIILVASAYMQSISVSGC